MYNNDKKITGFTLATANLIKFHLILLATLHICRAEMIPQGPLTFLLFSSLFFEILERLGGNVFLIFQNSKILLILVFVICETIDRKQSVHDRHWTFTLDSSHQTKDLPTFSRLRFIWPPLNGRWYYKVLTSGRISRKDSHGFSWIVMETKTSQNPSEYFCVHNHGKMGSLQNKDVSFTSLGYFYFHDYGRAGSISQTKGDQKVSDMRHTLTTILL